MGGHPAHHAVMHTDGGTNGGTIGGRRTDKKMVGLGAPPAVGGSRTAGGTVEYTLYGAWKPEIQQQYACCSCSRVEGHYLHYHHTPHIEVGQNALENIETGQKTFYRIP